MQENRVIKKAFAAIDNNSGHLISIQIRNYNGRTFRSGKRYGDMYVAEYFIELEKGVPKLVKNEKFQPYRETGWGGSDFDGHKGIDYEAIEVKKALGLNRPPTEEEIKEYFEGARR